MPDSQNSAPKPKPGEPESEWQVRVRRIRKETVLDVLESLGVTVDDVAEVQADFSHLRRSRKISEQVGNKVRLGVIGMLFALATWGVTWLLQTFGPQVK